MDQMKLKDDLWWKFEVFGLFMLPSTRKLKLLEMDQLQLSPSCGTKKFRTFVQDRISATQITISLPDILNSEHYISHYAKRGLVQGQQATRRNWSATLLILFAASRAELS